MIFVNGLLVFLLCSSCAQQLRLRVADSYMERMDYPAAIEIYEQILRKEEIPSAKINLAEAYRKINNTREAELWYAQVVNLPNADPLSYLYYGQMLQRNGKCELAKTWYNHYLKAVPDDVRGTYLLRACDYQNELMTQNAGLYDVRHLWFNSPQDDFSPALYKNKLFFTSDRSVGTYYKRSSSWNGEAFLKLFSTEIKSIGEEVTSFCSFAYSDPTLISGVIESRYHEASASFSSDGKEVYFTRSNFNFDDKGRNEAGVITLQLYRASVGADGKWGTAERLPFNSDAYSIMHPSLSPDGRFLFFASNMPGGFGGMDLYMVERVDGRYGQPVNLGAQINTEGNEVFPFSHQSGLLYFASDGQIGLGGLDIYMVEERGLNEWGTPENIGYPINTIADDFGIIFNEAGTCGYFASNRGGGKGGDDLYNFVKKTASVQVSVYDADTKEPLQNVLLERTCSNSALTTGSNGNVVLDMPLEQCCRFTAHLEGYQVNAVEGCTKNLTPGEEIRIGIPLRKELTFSLTGTVFDQNTGLPLEGATIELLNDCMQTPPPSVTTDDSGRFTFSLQKGCCFSLRVMREHYFGYTQEGHCTRGLQDSQVLLAKVYLQPRLSPTTELSSDGF